MAEESGKAKALQAIGAYMCAYSEATFELGETLKVLFGITNNEMAVAIVAATDRLGLNPRIGRLGAMAGTFEVVVRPYVIVYEIHRADVVVLRVWHGRQRRPGT